jgi:hypothetical protein
LRLLVQKQPKTCSLTVYLEFQDSARPRSYLHIWSFLSAVTFAILMVSSGTSAIVNPISTQGARAPSGHEHRASATFRHGTPQYDHQSSRVWTGFSRHSVAPHGCISCPELRSDLETVGDANRAKHAYQPRDAAYNIRYFSCG